MILSKRTIALLKNFQSIQPSILLMPGNYITTQSIQGDTGDIIAWAEVEEDFPVEFGIHDLSSFISTISLFEGDPELNFEENYVEISKGGMKFKFHRTSSSLISSPREKRVRLEGEYSFTISSEAMKQAIRISSTNSLPFLKISGKDGKVYMESTSEFTDNSLSSEYGEYTGDGDFTTSLRWENVRILPMSYEVDIIPSKFVRFQTPDQKLNYVISVDDIGDDYE
jgi:hypothetical protein